MMKRLSILTIPFLFMAVQAQAQDRVYGDHELVTNQLGKPLHPPHYPPILPTDKPIDSSKQSVEYQDATKSIMVMDKDEIKNFRLMLREYSKSAAYRPDLKKRNASVSIDERKSISCVPGYITTMNFVDALGNPWPIEYIVVSNKVILAKKADQYTIIMSASKFAGEVNLIVKMKGIPLTKNFYVNASDELLDSSRIVRLHGQSPTYKASLKPIHVDVPAIKSDAFVLEQFLSNTPPSDARKVATNRERIDVWVFHEKMYIRTPFTLASPMAMDSQGTVTDGRGMYVYRISAPVSRLNMLIEGKYFSVKVDI